MITTFDVAFHGHVHIGTIKGKTQDGIEVFNVAKPLLLRDGYDCPYFLYEITA
jgi:hypothetical protein